MQIVRVFNRDGKFTPHSSSFWNLVLVQFLLLISIADFPSVMDSRLIQAVVRIWGLCKLSVFLIVMENSPRLSKQFLEFCACSICPAQLDCKFSSIIGIADCVCGILIWCKVSLFLFDSHCHDCSAVHCRFVFAGGKFTPVSRCFELVKILLTIST